MANLKMNGPSNIWYVLATNLDTEIKKAVKKLKNKQIRDEKAALLAKETSNECI